MVRSFVDDVSGKKDEEGIGSIVLLGVVLEGQVNMDLFLYFFHLLCIYNLCNKLNAFFRSLELEWL